MATNFTNVTTQTQQVGCGWLECETGSVYDTFMSKHILSELVCLQETAAQTYFYHLNV